MLLYISTIPFSPSKCHIWADHKMYYHSLMYYHKWPKNISMIKSVHREYIFKWIHHLHSNNKMPVFGNINELAENKGYSGSQRPLLRTCASCPTCFLPICGSVSVEIYWHNTSCVIATSENCLQIRHGSRKTDVLSLVYVAKIGLWVCYQGVWTLICSCNQHSNEQHQHKEKPPAECSERGKHFQDGAIFQTAFRSLSRLLSNNW